MNPEIEYEDIRYLMNVQSAHNLIIRGLIRDNQKVAAQLAEFLGDMEPSNDNERDTIAEALKIIQRRPVK